MSQPSWSFNITNFQKKKNIHYGANGVVIQAFSVSLVPGHVNEYIISISFEPDLSNHYGSALDGQKMRSSVSLKGVALIFIQGFPSET